MFHQSLVCLFVEGGYKWVILGSGKEPRIPAARRQRVVPSPTAPQRAVLAIGPGQDLTPKGGGGGRVPSRAPRDGWDLPAIQLFHWLLHERSYSVIESETQVLVGNIDQYNRPHTI